MRTLSLSRYGLTSGPMSPERPSQRLGAKQPHPDEFWAGIREKDAQMAPGPAKPPTGTLSLSKHGLASKQLDPGALAWPEPIQNPVQGVLDFSRGFNSALASTLGLPLEAGDAIMKQIGASGFLDKPGNAQKAIKDAMQALGFKTDKQNAVSELAADLGSEFFNAAVILGATYAAAPWLAATPGTGTVANLARTSGQEALKRPGMLATGELGAAAGAELAERQVSEKYQPIATVGGAMLGGMAGAGVPSLLNAGRLGVDTLKGAVKGGAPAAVAGAFGGGEWSLIGGITGAAVGATRQLRRGTKRMLAEEAIPETTPLMPQGVEIQRARQFAVEAIEGDKMKLEQRIKSAISGVKGSPDPYLAAEKLRDDLKLAYKQAQSVADTYWGRVDKTLRQNPGPLVSFARQMLMENSKLDPDAVPGEIITSILDLNKQAKAALPKYGQAPGDPQERSISLKDAIALHSRINAALRERIPNDTLRHNLNRLNTEVLNFMETFAPGDTALQEAREFSLWLHNRFSRGAVGRYIGRPGGTIATDSELGDLFDPERSTQALVRRGEKSGAAIQSVAERLNIPQLTADSKQWVQNEFRKTAQEMDLVAAGKGRDLLRREDVRRFMQSFPQYDVEMQVVADRLDRIIQDDKTLQRSAFMKFSQQDPQAAVSRMFASSNKVKDAREIVSRLGADPDALKAFQYNILQEIFTNSGMKPTRIQLRIQSDDVQDMLKEVFTPAQYQRLHRIVKDAVTWETQTDTQLYKLMRGSTTIGSRMMGAITGRALHTRTLQTPQIFSEKFRQATDKLFFRVPPEELLQRAILDPEWERVLFIKIPSNLEEMKRGLRITRSLVSGLEAGSEVGEYLAEE